MWVCVKAYGGAYSSSLAYTLKAQATLCPSTFDETGALVECSSRIGGPESDKRHTSCRADGVCECKAPYAKPVPSVYPGAALSPCASFLVISWSPRVIP